MYTVIICVNSRTPIVPTPAIQIALKRKINFYFFITAASYSDQIWTEIKC